MISTRRVVPRALKSATSSPHPLHTRPLHTTLPRPSPIAKSAFPHLLRRDPTRPLPTLTSLSSTRKWLRTMPIFLAIIWVSAAGIFNYQKLNSPVITATLYALRTNQDVRDVLGDQVYFANRFAWIWGEMNLVQGRVDVTFDVKGSRERGVCRFRARRFGGRGGTFRTLEWSLTPKGGETIQLLDPDEPDPLSVTTL